MTQAQYALIALLGLAWYLANRSTVPAKQASTMTPNKQDKPLMGLPSWDSVKFN